MQQRGGFVLAGAVGGRGGGGRGRGLEALLGAAALADGVEVAHVARAVVADEAHAAPLRLAHSAAAARSGRGRRHRRTRPLAARQLERLARAAAVLHVVVARLLLAARSAGRGGRSRRRPGPS